MRNANSQVQHDDVVSNQDVDLVAEQAALGSGLLEQSGLCVLRDTVQPDDFYRPAHQCICTAAFELYDTGSPVDMITLTSKLQDSNMLERVGGAEYLFDLVNTVPTASNAQHYAQIVKSKSDYRRFKDIACRAWNQSYEDFTENGGGSAVIESMQSVIENGMQDIGATMYEAGVRIWNRLENETNPGIQLPYKWLRQYIPYVEYGNFLIIGGRPGSGKSIMLSEIADYVASEGIKTAILTTEMAAEDYAMRHITRRTGIPRIRQVTRALQDHEYKQIADTIASLMGLPLYIKDNITDYCTPAKLYASIRQLATQGYKVVMLDYIQGVAGEGENDNVRMKSVVNVLQKVALQCKIVVVATSQLSRQNELRDSGQLDAAAHTIIKVSRESKDTACIEIAKQREGQTGKLTCGFDGPRYRFSDPPACAEATDF